MRTERPDVNDRNDEFYQPWLREAAPPPAPLKRRYDPARPDEGLARDDATAPPLGIDLARYAKAEKPAAPPQPPLAERIRPAADAARSGAVRARAATVRGLSAFAQWTIVLGQRLDVPARVAALEIPRRSGVALARGKALAGAAARAIAAGTGRTGAIAGRELGRAGKAAQSGIGRAAAAGKAAGERQLGKLRSEPVQPVSPPESGLDRLLAGAPAAPVPARADTNSLPLFRAAPEAELASQAAPKPSASSATAPAASPVPAADLSADERPARPVSGSVVSDPSSPLPRWVLPALGLMALLALAFWLGGRWTGGAMTDAEFADKVRAAIVANPGIVPEALEAHRANQTAAAIADVRPILEKPFAGAWTGNAKGDVTLTVFTDYACVYCRASLPDLDRLVREDKGVKIVFRELPIIAPQSKDAALAALAAARQGRYDAFHHAMFAAPALDRAAIAAASTRAGVILDGRSDANADARLFEREIDNNLALAQQLRIDATPTIIVGSQLIAGAVGFDALKKAVAAARAAD